MALSFSVLTVADNINSSDRLSLRKDCTAGSFCYSLFMSELSIHNIKRVKCVLTHHRKVRNLIICVVPDKVQES